MSSHRHPEPVHRHARYSLARGAVDAVDPPPGASAPVTVLPHIVFKNPHLPWDRHATFVDRAAEDKDATPWLLLLVFTPDELRLEEKQLADVLHRLPNVEARQSETMAVRVRARETPLLDRVVNGIPFDEESDARDADCPVHVVFLRKELFVSLLMDPVAKTGALDVSQYKYLAHVRRVAVDAGKPGVAAGEDDDEAELRSLVVAPRVGPLGLREPTETVVHLVSLDTRKDLALSSDSDRVALVSLYSWRYHCLPSEGGASPQARLQRLGANLTILHPHMPIAHQEKETLGSTGDSSATVTIDEIIQQRRKNGYNLVRHRTETGDAATSIIRGPFAPRPIRHIRLERGTAIQCDSGADLEVLDRTLSMTDITYSSAWQLGHRLATDDEAFSSTLLTLRETIYESAPERPEFDSRDALAAYHARGGTSEVMSELLRELEAPDEALQATDEALAAGSPDLGAVCAWVADRLRLADVATAVLVPDPAYLPPETLRVFCVDQNWVDSFVDGALSVGNYDDGAPKEDFCRHAIKAAMYKRLERTPRSGFLLRSQLLVQFPDVAVEVELVKKTRTGTAKGDEPEGKGEEEEDDASSKGQVLMQRRLAGFESMYCLFGCAADEVAAIVLTPHFGPKQRFAIGSAISADELTVSYKKTYTAEPPDPEKRGHGSDGPGTTETFPLRAGEVFDLRSRTLKVRPYLDRVREALCGKGDGNDDSSDGARASALLALQLSESSPELRIAMPMPPATSP